MVNINQVGGKMWDKKYDTDVFVYGKNPNDFLAKNYKRLPKGRILCLAEGEGRNAVFLAKQGYQVTAVDNSQIGLNKALKLAKEQDVEVEIICTDLAEYDLGESYWDGIVSIFCHLPSKIRIALFDKVSKSLKSNGVFLLEGYTPKQLSYNTGGPASVDMMFSKNILQDELSTLKFLVLEEVEREIVEGEGHNGLGAVVQCIAVQPKYSNIDGINPLSRA